MARKSFKSLLRPIDGPRRNPVRFWINSKQNHYELWKRKAERAETEEKRIEYEANAYVTDEGFYHYCTEILGYDKFHPPFHSRMTNFIVGKDLDYYFVKRKRLLEGFRGCFKSSALSIGYTTWLVAREYVLSRETRALLQQIHAVDEDGAAILSEAERVPLERERQALVASGQHLDGVNIKIGLASEELTLPADHVGASCAVMEGELYCKYFGEHAPKDRKKGAKWGRTGATSVYRTNIALRDPTIWTISLDAPRTGRHFDVIIPDDLQAERSSASRNQLRETWRLYKLLFPLLDPPEISHYSEIVMGATRWHEQDIYGKIEAENEHHAKQDRTEILKLPVCTEAEVATCPTIYKTEAISSLKAGGIDEYNTQYLLKPRSGKTQAFKPEWIRYYGPGEIREVVGQGYYVTGADFCWVEAAKRNDSDRTIRS